MVPCGFNPHLADMTDYNEYAQDPSVIKATGPATGTAINHNGLIVGNQSYGPVTKRTVRTVELFDTNGLLIERTVVEEIEYRQDPPPLIPNGWEWWKNPVTYGTIQTADTLTYEVE